jgi:HSP20 family protein
MRQPDNRTWMLAQAIGLLQSADQLQRQFFRLGQPADGPVWEPPMDMVMDEPELRIFIALPGIDPERLSLTLDAQTLVACAERAFGERLGPGAVLHMEIPYGRFERRIALPDGNFRLKDMQLEHGCLQVTLERLA